MKDLIDERNRRESIQRSIIKRMHVHYVTKEEMAKQQEDEEQKAKEREYLAEKEVEEWELRQKQKKEQEEAKAAASAPPSSMYGMGETDEVTKEQVAAILAEKRKQLDQVIEENKQED